jgi:hypothetical protein
MPSMRQLFPPPPPPRYPLAAVEDARGRLRPKMSDQDWRSWLANHAGPARARSAAVATRPGGRTMMRCTRSFSFRDQGGVATFTAGRSYAGPDAPCVRRYPENWAASDRAVR